MNRLMTANLEEQLDNPEAIVVYTEHCNHLERAEFDILNLMMMMIPGPGMIH